MEKLHRLFTDNWAVRRADLEGALAILMPSILQGNLAAVSERLSNTKISAEVINPYQASWWELDDVSLPDDSVAVIRMKGMLYSWETETLIDLIAQVESNPKVCGLVLVIDGPGGMASYVDQASAALRAMTKPSATFINGTMASAHFWIGTSTGRTFIVDSPLCEVGSVGVVVNYYSFRKFLEQAGIKHYEIYPDMSDLKNRAIRDLEENDDDTLIKASAERLHKAFADAVSENTGIPYNPELPLYRGEMFTAEEAVDGGIIDQFGTLKDAILWVLAQSAINNNQ